MHWSTIILFFLAFVIVVIFVFIDLSILGRFLFTFKTHEDGKEYYKNDKGTSEDAKTPYINLTSSYMVTQDDKTRTVSATKDVTQCKDSCTYDDKCQAFMFDGITQNCKLMYDIQGYEINKDGLFSLSGGIKQRDFIGNAEPDRKFLRFEKTELPPDGVGKLETKQFVKSIHQCRNHCMEYQSPTTKCMAFEYNFKDKSCTLNDRVASKMPPKEDKDTYLIIN